MRQTSAFVMADDGQVAAIRYCPNCKVPKIMSLHQVRTAMFGGDITITFKCDVCGTEKIDRIHSDLQSLHNGPRPTTDWPKLW